jgi:hypothetical protein
MKRRSRALPLARVLAFAGALAGCHDHAFAEREGPFLSIERQESVGPQGGPPVARSAELPGAIALAFGGLPPEELTRLGEGLEESADIALRRAAPELFDVTGLAEDASAPPSSALREVLPDLPALTAAANLLGAPWTASGLSVTLGPTCAAHAQRCLPLFRAPADPEDALVRRGRALAWSFSNAAILRVPASSRAALLRSLRAAQLQPARTIALVFDAAGGTLDEGRVGRLREQARAALVRVPADAPVRSWLDALAAAPSRWALPIALGADEVLVVPRLSALARMQDFRAELDLGLEPRRDL